MLPEVKSWLENLPADQREVLADLRRRILAALPQAEEQWYEVGKFPIYLVDGQWAAGLAARKDAPRLYLCQGGIVERHAERLGRLVVGKGCLAWKPGRQFDAQQLSGLADELLAELSAVCSRRAGHV